jgi:hypothetical protein
VPKTLVYRLVDFRDERDEQHPVPRSIVERPPSAELRPDQKDADSLPDYDTLDAILEAYVEEDAGREQLALAGLPGEASRRCSRSSTGRSTSAARRRPASRSRRARSAVTGACRSPTPTGAAEARQPGAQRVEHLGVQEVAEADPGDAQLGEPLERRRAGTQQHVDGDPGLDERRDRRLVRDPDRVDAVRAGVAVGAGALERRGGVAAAEVDVDPRVEDDIAAGLDRRDPGGLHVGRLQRRVVGVVRVLEVEAHRAGVQQAPRQLVAASP